MAETTDKQSEMAPRLKSLLSGIASFGPLFLLVAVGGLYAERFFAEPAEVEEPPVYLTSVAVTLVQGESRERSVQLAGQAVPDRQVILRLPQDARVTRIPVRLGEKVAAGQTICEVRYSGQRRSAALTTPIAGKINALNGAPGSVLREGASCATIIDTSSMIITTDIGAHEAAVIRAGNTADVSIGGYEHQAQVHYIHPTFDDAGSGERTLELHTDDLSGLTSGASATITVQTQQIEAAIVPQEALVMIPGQGLSVRMVTGNGPTGTVQTVPVEIIAASSRGLYVRGLPAEARIILKGQLPADFLDGELVRIDRVA